MEESSSNVSEKLTVIRKTRAKPNFICHEADLASDRGDEEFGNMK